MGEKTISVSAVREPVLEFSTHFVLFCFLIKENKKNQTSTSKRFPDSQDKGRILTESYGDKCLQPLPLHSRGPGLSTAARKVSP